MQDWIIYDKKEIKDRQLFLQFHGETDSLTANGKLRIIALFTYADQKRYFPMDAVCHGRDGHMAFEVERTITLSDVFFEFQKQEEEQVSFILIYCDANGKWQTLSKEEFFLADLFVKKQKKTGFWKRNFKKLQYVCYTLLLPIWIIDGFLAVKGIKKSRYIDEEIKGKKGIFYHAHGLVKAHTGYGYSIREIKTSYFKKCYEKQCRKVKKTQGILFLSERSLEKGGNLDRVRKAIEQTSVRIESFIDTRPIRKLPFDAIKRAAFLAAEAKVIVLEDFYPQLHVLTIRKDTKVVQLWHACGAFKMFGLSEVDKIPHLTQDTRNHRNYSMVPVSSRQMVPFYSEAFGITPQKVYPVGVPRTDVFFDKAYQQKVTEELYEKYPALQNKKVILFAPTFRGSGKTRAFYPKDRFVIDRLMESLTSDTVLLVKQHPFVRQQLECSEKYRSRVFDFTGKENINDLLFITSLLITDYSSSIFEAALLKIPMLFYVFDLKEYEKQRDIYFDFSTFVPGKQVQTMDELADQAQWILEQKEKDDHTDQKLQAFCSYFLGALDGNSTKRTVDLILDLEKMPNS